MSSEPPSEKKLLEQYRSAVDAFVKDHLPDKTADWFGKHTESKIIHDSLWGTFEVLDYEMALVDTRLMQRLRRIHQTGAVYLVYPSARHSRFEHSLGVLHQVTRMCEELDRGKLPDRQPGSLFRDRLPDLRFAALLHDTGHGPFSHTSEQFFAQDSDFEALKSEIGWDPGLHESIGEGEMLSFMIITSGPLRAFVDELNDKYHTDINLDRIGQYITGSIDVQHYYASEVIHGPFDADKLDYMPRDSAFTGFKMNIDLDRLYWSIDVKRGVNGERRLAGSVSGTAPLMQIMFNKMQLFMSVYHHHKVRAVDCMLYAVFELAYKTGRRLAGIELSKPYDFLRLTDDLVLCEQLTQDEDILEIIQAIQNRLLWKRALVINRRTTPETMHETADNNDGPLVRFKALGGNSPEKIARRRRIAEMIWERAGRPCKKHEVWLDVPKSPKMVEAAEMWISSRDGGGVETLDKHIPVEEWVKLYGTHRQTSHVFCPPEHLDSIGRAAKDILWEELGLELNERAFTAAKLSAPSVVN